MMNYDELVCFKFTARSGQSVLESRTGMLQAQVQHWQRKLLRRSPGRRTMQPTGEAKVRSHAETVSEKKKEI